jgi:hypothetical protein
MVQAAFAQAGVEVALYADYVRDAAGRQFGLSNVAALCHNDARGERAWRGIIGDHVRNVLASTNQKSPFETMDRADILAATYVRLMPAEDLLPTMKYARPIAPSLVEVLNLDLPTTIAYFSDERVAEFGYETLRHAGLSNLRAVKVDEHQTLEQNGGTIEVLLGESMFTASLLVLIEHVLGRYHLTANPDLGVFVGVPNRHQLAFHVLTDASAIPSLNMLVAFTAAAYRDSAGVLSPDVHWWRPVGLTQVSRLTPDGPRIEVDTELTAVLEQLARQ